MASASLTLSPALIPARISFTRGGMTTPDCAANVLISGVGLCFSSDLSLRGGICSCVCVATASFCCTVWVLLCTAGRVAVQRGCNLVRCSSHAELCNGCWVQLLRKGSLGNALSNSCKETERPAEINGMHIDHRYGYNVPYTIYDCSARSPNYDSIDGHQKEIQ